MRLKLDQLHITDLDSGTDKTVPLADVAVIVCAARDTEFSSSSLRRMAELNVLLLICNEKFEPCAVTLPYLTFRKQPVATLQHDKTYMSRTRLFIDCA